MSCPKHQQPCAECERLQEIESSAMQGLADTLRAILDDETSDCRKSLGDKARAALGAATPFLEAKP